MSDLNGVNQKVFAIMSGWVQRKSISSLDIETCNGVARKDSSTNTCWQCVALNKTVFKEEKNPSYTHPNCKCTFNHYYLKNAIMKFAFSKIDAYLFIDVDKKAMMKTMGYVIEDSQEIYNLVYNITKSYFENGNYKLGVLNKFGQHFQINFKMTGKRDHVGENFNCHTGCIAYPNGRILVATPLIKD